MGSKQARSTGKSDRRDAARLASLGRWNRYRREVSAAERKAKESLAAAQYGKSADRLWSVKSKIDGSTARKDGFRTKAGAKLWLKERLRFFLRDRRAKALAALPAEDRAIAKAFAVEE